MLVVGSGPAGLEAAMMLGRRGYEVVLAEAAEDLGGRVARERRLPGLAAWGRVADYRLGQLDKLANVELYRASRLTADEVLSFGFQHVAVATGSRWRDDGVARRVLQPVPCAAGAEILTPDDIMAGRRPMARTVAIYDDDHYYMGGVLAELLAREGYGASIVTPAADVSNWMHMTMEQHLVQQRLLDHAVRIVAHRLLVAATPAGIEIACVFTGRRERIETGATVLVTARLPENQLALDLHARRAEWADAGLRSVTAIGDALAPGTIAAAVHSGRRYAEELDGPAVPDEVPFRREVAGLAPVTWSWRVDG